MLAAGSQANFFDTEGAEQYAFPLYSLEEAERLRSRVLAVFEDADRDPKLVEEGALNFVIVGGGPTGTELAGALADMINLTMTREYTDLAVKRARVYLVEHGHALLAPFSAEGPRLRGPGAPAEGCAIAPRARGEGSPRRSRASSPTARRFRRARRSGPAG